MPPLAIRAYTASTALGHGLPAQAAALRERRSGLRRNDFAPLAPDQAPLDCWIGRVEGIEQAPLPPALAHWDCRNNRLAWLSLNQDGLPQAIAAAVARHGAERVAVIVGTSTSSIGATEEAYARLHGEPPRFPADLDRPQLHTPHSPGAFVAAATGLRGPCVTVATACSSSAKCSPRPPG